MIPPGDNCNDPDHFWGDKLFNLCNYSASGFESDNCMPNQDGTQPDYFLVYHVEWSGEYELYMEPWWEEMGEAMVNVYIANPLDYCDDSSLLGCGQFWDHWMHIGPLEGGTQIILSVYHPDGMCGEANLQIHGWW